MTSRLLAILAVKKAGAYLRQQFKQDARVFALKSAHEIVTRADKGAEKIILTLLKKHSTNARILSEESGLYDYNSNWLWVVDPLDGTTNFRVHNPLFSIFCFPSLWRFITLISLCWGWFMHRIWMNYL
ncbi:MAG: hypothetical protein UV92_C0022G0002 [Parcubacteria group bacterium GW2011_GWA1_43_27]|nr:MAG: hypothetical protein UV92_C0022G0002 [Parcubacteria group bacterium GW2011_GWA1_43_27]